MSKEFWEKRWNEKKVGFNQEKPNSLLVSQLENLPIKKGARIFVPLCGKTIDIDWLLSRKYRVLGVEFHEDAVMDLFKRLNLTFKTESCDSLKCFSAGNIDVFIGDFFELTKQLVGKVDAIYDRASYVALPEDARKRYSSHLVEISLNKPQLLITYLYDQNLMTGPPHSISDDEIYKHYGQEYMIKKVASIDVVGGLKGQCPAKENAYLLT